MQTLFVSAAVIAAVVWIGIGPVKAAPSVPRVATTNIHVAPVENVGYRRRYYRRYGYPVPHAYYPPAFDSSVPSPAYADSPPGYYPPPVGDYAGAPAPGGDYADAPDEGYADVEPPDDNYADAPPPEGY